VASIRTTEEKKIGSL